MKKAFILIMVIFSMTSCNIAQVRNTPVCSVPHADSAYKRNLPAGSEIIDLNTHKVYILTAPVPDTLTLSATQSKTEISNNGLIAVTENGKSGYRLAGADTTQCPNIGTGAVDLSKQSNNNGTFGNYSVAMNLFTQPTGNYSLASGVMTKASGESSCAFGDNSMASGNHSSAFNYNTEASGNDAAAFGSYTKATGASSFSTGKWNIASGKYSFCGGSGYSTGGSNGINKYAAGEGSFNFSNSFVSGSNAMADYSAILGGTNNNINSGATNSVVLGGVQQTATHPNMVYLPTLKLQPQTSPPANPESGTVCFGDNHFMGFNGTEWLNLDNINSGITSDSSYWSKNGNYIFPKTLTDSVGIGTNIPTVPLEVNGDAKFIHSNIHGSTKTGSVYYNINDNLIEFGHHLGVKSGWWGLQSTQSDIALQYSNTIKYGDLGGINQGVVSYLSNSGRFSNLTNANMSIGFSLADSTRTPLERLEVNGAVKLGSTASNHTGTIQWDGNHFKGYNGSSWVNLDEDFSNTNQGTTKITEHYKTGICLQGDNRDFKRDIGNNAIDFTSGGFNTSTEYAGASGDNSFATGCQTAAIASASMAIGRYTRSTGVNSFTGGSSYNSYTPLRTTGFNSFTYEYINNSSKGNFGNYSCILAGMNNSIKTGASNSGIISGNSNTVNDHISNSVILGGSGQTATQSYMVYVPAISLTRTGTPSNPVAGNIYYSGTHFKGYNDSLWVNLDETASGLETVTENGKTGWRLIGEDALNHGNTGTKAIDMSIQPNSGDNGATGDYSFAIGYNNKASGYNSYAQGNHTESSGYAAHTEGGETEAPANFSHAEGYETQTTGNYSHAGGKGAGWQDEVEAAGNVTFVHQEVEAGAGTKKAEGDNSAILGGKNNTTATTAQRSVVLGGIGQNAVQPDMVYVPALKLLASSAPATPESGTVYFDETAKRFKGYNGSEWVNLDSVSSSATPDAVYAEKYLDSIAQLVAANKNYTVIWAQTGELSGMATNDSSVTALSDGRYLVNISGSFSMDDPSATVEGWLYINGVKDTQTGFILDAGANSDANGHHFRACVAANGVVNLQSGDVLTFKVKTNVAGVYRLYVANCSITKL